MELGPGATRDAVRKAEEALEISLPEDYVEFMVGSNGGEIEVGENQLRLWPIEELSYMNEGYEVDLNVPGLVLFGTDGGMEAYGFDTEGEEPRVVMIPFVPMERGAAIPCGRTFTEFLENLRRGDSSSAGDEDGDQG